MDIIALFEALKAQIADLQAKIADAQAVIAAVEKAAYDKGFADGVKSVGGDDKIYTQAELDAKIEEALAPVKAELVEVKSQLAALELDFPVKIEAAKAEAKAELKAELKKAYADQQVVESQSETGFGSLLD